MKGAASSFVSDEAFAKRAERWSMDTPDTKEAYYIREIFDSQYDLTILNTCHLKSSSNKVIFLLNLLLKLRFGTIFNVGFYKQTESAYISGGFLEEIGVAQPTQVAVPLTFTLQHK